MSTPLPGSAAPGRPAAAAPGRLLLAFLLLVGGGASLRAGLPGAYREQFTALLLRAHDRLPPWLQGQEGLRRGVLLQEMYSFAIIQVALEDPELTPEQVFEQAAEIMFSPRSLAAASVFLGTQAAVDLGGAGLQRAGAALRRIGPEAAARSLRWGGRLASASGVPVAAGALHASLGAMDLGDRRGARLDQLEQALEACRDPAAAARLRRVAARHLEAGPLEIFLASLDPARLDYGLVLAEGFGWLGGAAVVTAVTGNPAAGVSAASNVATAASLAYRDLQVRLFTAADAREEAEALARGPAELDPPPPGADPAAEVARLGVVLRETTLAQDSLQSLVTRGQGEVNRGFQALAGALRDLAVQAQGLAGYARSRDLFVELALEAGAAREEVRRAYAALPPGMRVGPYPGQRPAQAARQELLRRVADLEVLGRSGVWDAHAAAHPDARGAPGVLAAVVGETRRTLAQLVLPAPQPGSPVPGTLRGTRVGDALGRMWAGNLRAGHGVRALRRVAARERELLGALEADRRAELPGELREVLGVRAGLLARDRAVLGATQAMLEARLPGLPLEAGALLAEARAAWDQALAPLRELAGRSGPAGPAPAAALPDFHDLTGTLGFPGPSEPSLRSSS